MGGFWASYIRVSYQIRAGGGVILGVSQPMPPPQDPSVPAALNEELKSLGYYIEPTAPGAMKALG